MTRFVPKKSLLNPKFEGYKLQSLEQAECVTRFPLEYSATQSTATGNTLLSFQEMRSRITHNHLAVDSERGRSLYVDKEGRVCLIDLKLDDQDEVTPSVQAIYQFPASIETAEVVSSSDYNAQREYPSAAFLSPTCVLVADGRGMLYILPIRDTLDEEIHTDKAGEYSSQPIGVFALQLRSPVDIPFRLHALRRASPTQVLLLLSARHFPSEEKKKNTNIQCDIFSAKIDLLSLRGSSSILQPRPLDLIWQRRGFDFPSHVAFVPKVDSWLIISGSTYVDPNAPPKESTQAYEPKSDEIVPIPREGENLDDNKISQPPKPHPYSWAQSEDTITVTFLLPSSANKNDLKVIITTQTLTIHVQSSIEPAVPGIPIPHYSAQLLWDSVNSSSCFWTWDREGEKRYGLLTLHMEKKHEGTRWPQIFATVNVKDENGNVVKQEHEDVPETMDPSELWKIRESLEKYTSSLMTGEDASGLGLGTGVPSLAGGEMDEEVDAAVGRDTFITWAGMAGEEITFDTQTTSTSGTTKTISDWEDESEQIKVLSTPLPGSSMDSSTTPVSLVLKKDLDGLLYQFTLPSPSDTGLKSPTEWEHTITFPALAFVLASKQDTRFTYHLPALLNSTSTSTTSASSQKPIVFAFESGTLTSGGGNRAFGRGGNVYIYHPPQKPKDNWAKQAILKVGEGEGGALLGVGCAYVQGEKTRKAQRIIICLTEDTLVLLRNL